MEVWTKGTFMATVDKMPMLAEGYEKLQTDVRHLKMVERPAIVELGFKVVATGGTADHLAAEGIEVERVNKVAQGRPHIVDKIKDGEIDLIFNTTEGWQSHKDSASIRASALMAKVPYFTTAASSAAVTRAIGVLRARSLDVQSLQSYYIASRT